RLHGSCDSEAGSLRGCEWRYSLPRRDWRHSPGTAAETSARTAGTGVRAAGQYADPPRRCARRGGNESGSQGPNRGEAVPNGSLLPPQRLSYRPSTTTPAPGRHSDAGSAFCEQIRWTHVQTDLTDSKRSDGRSDGLSVARKYSRAAEF